MIELNGDGLTLETVERVALDNETVGLSKQACRSVDKARAFVEEKMRGGEAIYGLTTGFGKFADRRIADRDVETLQRNLIVSHACGMGEPFEKEVVRAIMLLRLNALAVGRSGIRLSTMQMLLDMLNRGVHPVIPEQGSLGASGDLAPLAHMVLPMIGLGRAEFEGKVYPGAEAMRLAGIAPVTLAAKEGLALINGTQVMTAVGALTTCRALRLVKTADIVSSLTGQALYCIPKAYDEKVHLLRGHPGQIACGENMRRLLENSGMTLEPGGTRVQDAYSIRCIPQIHGASRDAIDYVKTALLHEINAVTDNPLIFPDEDEVISSGNFHGQPMALAFDFLGIALSELADVSERRIERLVNPQLNGELPAFLAVNGGLNSGFMIAQYAAASLVSENKVFAHPASVDSIPSSANQEDHVSMGTIAARKARSILHNAERVLAVELFTAGQALSILGSERLSPATKPAYDRLREDVPFLEEDAVMYEQMDKCERLVASGALIDACEATCGALH